MPDSDHQVAGLTAHDWATIAVFLVTSGLVVASIVVAWLVLR